MPFYLNDLFITKTLEVKHFQQQINVYNNAMAFIFCMFNQDKHLNHSVGEIQSFVIYEKLYHLQRPLQHSFTYVSSFAQVYLYNPQAATGYWFVNTDKSLCEHILLWLAETLHECNNPFINIYHSAKEVLNQHQQESVWLTISLQMCLIVKTESDECCINLSTVNEMAVILSDEYDQLCFCNIMICSHHTGGAQHDFSYVHFSHAAYMLFQYSLLFSYDDSGWTWTFQLQRWDAQFSRIRILQQMYYWYHLFKCLNQTTALFYVWKFAQKYIVDAYVIIDQQHLKWIKHHQN